MINLKRLLLHKEFLENRIIPIFSAIFFLIWRFFFNFLLWQNRILPPEPGDSFNYLNYIRSIKIGYVNLTSDYTIYSFILGNIAKIFSLSPEVVFRYSFWFGLVILTVVFWFLFKKLKFSWIQTSLSFIFLAFYTGHGAFHGFYWVVPSFFLLIAFFYLFANIISDKKINWWFVGLVSFVYPLIHGMGVFSLAIFIFYVGFYLFFSFLNSKVPLRKFIQGLDKKVVFRTGLVCIVIFTSYCLATFLLPKINVSINDKSEATMNYSNMIPLLNSYQISIGNSNNVYNFLTNPILSENDLKWQDSNFGKIILREIENIFNFQRAQSVKKVVEIIIFRFNNFRFNYLGIVCPNLIFSFCWVFIFYVLFRYRENKILALFFSVLLFSFISSLLHYNGYRSLLFLWPVTYILLIYSFPLIFKFIKDFFGNLKIKRFNGLKNKPKILSFLSVTSRIAFILSVLVFLFCNIAYSFWYIESKNNYLNFNYNLNMFKSLLADYNKDDSVIYFDDYLTISAFLKDNNEKGFELKKLQVFDVRNQLASSDRRKIVVFLEDDSIYNQNQGDSFWKLILHKVARVISIKTRSSDSNNLLELPFNLGEKLSEFYFNDINNFKKELYNDGRYYVFELMQDE